ncbi:MAG: right-handed parallel beta-helix repeat-containing protein [Acidobacteriota bacterium]
MQILIKQSSPWKKSFLSDQKRRTGPLCLAAFLLLAANANCKTNVPVIRPTIHKVGNNADSGEGSLRNVINNANRSPGADIINFDLPKGATRIKLQTPLPPIRNGITINGFNKSGERVELDGLDAGSEANGLKIIGIRNTVQGLAIHSFQGNGIMISKEPGSAGNAVLPAMTPEEKKRLTLGRFIAENQVVDNFIGTNASGTERMSNGKDGVFVDINSVNVLIQRNRIAYNNGNGVSLSKGPNPPFGIRISNNLIALNGGISIDLGNDGNTPNGQHAGDRNGPNHWQPYPFLKLAKRRQAAPNLRGAGFLPDDPAATLSVTINISFPPKLDPKANYTIEFFSCSCDSTCPSCTDFCLMCGPACRNCSDSEVCPAAICQPDLGTNSLLCMPSQIPLKPIVVTSNSNGTIDPFDHVLTLPAGFKGIIYATASRENADTSEKSNCVAVR